MANFFTISSLIFVIICCSTIISAVPPESSPASSSATISFTSGVIGSNSNNVAGNTSPHHHQLRPAPNVAVSVGVNPSYRRDHHPSSSLRTRTTYSRNEAVAAVPVASVSSSADVPGPAANSAAYLSADRQKRSYLAYRFADGVEYVVPEIRETFSCVNREYGYYADVGNNCHIFHVCVPPAQQFSFFCPNQTLFDQRLLICQDQYTATPCQDAERYYVVNQNFGVLETEKLIAV